MTRKPPGGVPLGELDPSVAQRRPVDRGQTLRELAPTSGLADASSSDTGELPPLPTNTASAEVLRSLPAGSPQAGLGDPLRRHKLEQALPGSRGKVLAAGDVPTFAFVEGIRVREMYNSPADESLSIATTWIEPGMTTALHTLDVAERQRVVRGSGFVELGGAAPIIVKEGDVIDIPPGLSQRITNVGPRVLELDCICTPRFTVDRYHHLEDPSRAPAAIAVDEVGEPNDVVAVVPRFGESRKEKGEQVAVVTGGYGGIGLEACRQLGRQGFTVVIAGRDEAKGTAAQRLLREEGIEAHFLAVDVTKRDQVSSFSAHVERELGRCDVLVNCAGLVLDGPGQETDGDTFARTFATNVTGPVSMTEAFLPLMTRQGAGRVVNVTSEFGTSGWRGTGFVAYAASKAALNQSTRSMAESCVPAGVAINAVDPGWVRTSMGGPNAPDSVTDGVQALLWLATTDTPPTGLLLRRGKNTAVPDGWVAIEREAW